MKTIKKSEMIITKNIIKKSMIVKIDCFESIPSDSYNSLYLYSYTILTSELIWTIHECCSGNDIVNFPL